MRLVKPLDPDINEVVWQIGAECGIDDVGKMINQYTNWIYHLFEPNPEPFKKLQNRHKDNPNVHLYELAIIDTNEPTVDFYIPTNFTDPEKPWAKQVAGLTPDVANKFELEPLKITVNAIRFHRMKEITNSVPSLLITDTEGNDHRFINLVRNHRPKVYKFEMCHMTQEILQDHRNKLRSWGYAKEFSTNLDDVWFRID